MTGKLISGQSLFLGVLLLSLSPAFPAHAASGLVELTSGWSFRPGDSPLNPQGQPAWLSEASAPGEWLSMKALAAPPSDVNGFVWIRIPLPTGDWYEPTVVLGGLQGGAAEFYTSRKVFQVGKLHASGPEERDPDGVVTFAVSREDLGHDLYVRLQQTPHPTGIQKSARLGAPADHLRHQLAFSLPPLMATGILLSLVLITLVGFAFRPADIYLLHCSMFAFFAALLAFGVSGAQSLVNESGAFWASSSVIATMMLIPTLAAFMSTAILEGTDQLFAKVVRVLQVLGATGSVAVLLDDTIIQRFLPLLLLFLIGGMLTNSILGLRAALAGNIDARIFSVGVAIFFCVITYDSLSVVGVFSSERFHSHIGLLAVTSALMLVVIRRHLVMSVSLEQHVKENEARHSNMTRLSLRLAENARTLVGAVARLRQTSDVQQNLVDRQAGTMQEIVATAQEINQASRVASEKATTIMDAATRADTANQSIGRDVDEGMSGISSVASEVAEMASRMRALEQRTRQIAGIVDTVKDLADQSNMLALNAAIEAVRSGEAGKGFVVVAREMRSLADLSLQATSRIREVLASANDGIREAADLSARGEARIQQSLTQLQGSGAQLRSLGQIVQDSNSSVRQISAAIGQQSAGVSQVFVALNDFNKQMNETVEGLRETREAAASVEAVADAMSAALAESGGAVLVEAAAPAVAMKQAA